MTKIKICGITNLSDALFCAKLGVDVLGFVFYKKSPRYISPLTAKKIMQKLSPFISCVGVFVNEKEAKVKKIAKFCGINILQFHGDEKPDYCEKFADFKVIKAFRVKDALSLKGMHKFKVSAYLLDTFKQGQFGGTGKTFNWDLLKGLLKAKEKIILSGGINLENIQEAIKRFSPYAVDISSGVEISPGVKSPKLIRQLFKRYHASSFRS